MREPAVVREGKGRTANPSHNVQIRSLGGERKRESSERCLAIQSGAPHARAGQKVSQWFQARMSILHAPPSSDTPRRDSPRRDSPLCRPSEGDAERPEALPKTTAYRPHQDGVSKVNASGTTPISAGNLPINSPSAST